MTIRLFSFLILVATAIGAGPLQTAAPVRPLGPTIRVSSVTFGSIAQVRQLSDGRVLVNDAARRQVVLLDASLSNPRVIIDSVSGQGNSYGTRSASIIAFAADSTLFVDASSQALLVIDPAGRIARVMAIPPAPGNAAANLASRAFGTPAFHPARGLVFGARCPCPPPRRLAPGLPEVTFVKPDSALIVAVNLVTRSVDTLAYPIIGYTTVTLTPTSTNQLSGGRLFPSYDDWALTLDGSIAMLRPDFHVDWIAPDGSRTATARLPFDWRRITDEDKTRLADSINTVRQQRYRTGLEQFLKDSVARLISPDDGGRPELPPVVSLTDFPDYMPAFARGALRADADGNLWIRVIPGAPIPGGPVYDIVNRKGEIFDRVQAREGRSVVDFGPGGTVYLVARDAGLSVLEQARFK